ncbi:FtsX-like permease family protein [Candidatus Bathyarchaeota archaeon]|nr:MAG: FtsX-like permease family protein [Candidatus Bathyarchaeota archaeon]
MCLRNLFRRKLRSLLCIIGVALAVTITVAVVAATTRYTTVIEEMNVYFNGKIVVVARGVFIIQAFPIGGALPESVVNTLKDIDAVEAVVPMLFNLNFKLENEGTQSFPFDVTIGIPAGNWSVLVGSTTLKNGSWPSAESDSRVVVGPSLAGQYNVTVGSTIEIEKHELEVSGIMETRSAFLSRSVIMPLKLAQETFRYPMQVNMVIVTPDEKADEKELSDRIEKKISYVMALSDHERNELTEPILSQVEAWNMGIKSVLFFLSMVLVTVVAVINVSERRKDFATLVAIGASRGFIVRVVMTETFLIGLFGGLIGLVFGTIGALWLGSTYTGIPITLFFPGVFEVVPLSFMLEILVSTVTVSCIAGVIPSIAATRMNITEVLRAEY